MPGLKRKYARATWSSRKKTKTYDKMPKSLTRLPSPYNNSMLARGQYLKVNLKYSEFTSLDAGIATATTYLFAANGCYQPNITGGGHQPAGFDQYMTLYELYTVTRAWIKVTFINSDSTNPQIVGIANRDLTSTSADYRVYIENGATNWAVVGKSGSGSEIKTLTQEMNLRQYSNNKDIMSEDNYAGTDALNPQETQYFFLFVAAADGASNPGAVNVIVDITYEVYFRQPKQAALS